MAKKDPKAFLAGKKKAITNLQQTHELKTTALDFQEAVEELNENSNDTNQGLGQKADRLIEILQKIKTNSDLGNTLAANETIAQLIESFSPQGVIEVSVKNISPSSQPRVTFDRELLEKLARSIETHGQLVPIILIPLPDGKYQIFDGERRWRSIGEILKRSVIKAIALSVQPANLYRHILITNIHREDLNALDKAEAIIAEINQVNPNLDADTIGSRLRALLRRHERAKTLNLISALTKLSQQEQQLALNRIEFKDRVERTILEVIVSLQLNPSNIVRAVFPALNLNEQLKSDVRQRGLAVSQALALNKFSPEQLTLLDRQSAIDAISFVKEKVICDRLSLNNTKALIKETIALYSDTQENQYQPIEKWLGSFEGLPLDRLKESELKSLQKSLRAKLKQVIEIAKNLESE
ncbi:MAG: ParB/RepB/Spo0J family partition protein [Prochloraceae cyanobacterium]|nr:ParB/RepB/Spo0J family partition protein [Prochloraceae cyanobacterium]